MRTRQAHCGKQTGHAPHIWRRSTGVHAADNQLVLNVHYYLLYCSGR